ASGAAPPAAARRRTRPAAAPHRGGRPHRDHHRQPRCDAAAAHGRARAAQRPAHTAAESRRPVPRAHRQGAARVIRRLLSVWHARNLEFVRDRGTLIFTILLPIALVVGMSFVFGNGERALFKVGVIAQDPHTAAHPFLKEQYVEFIAVQDEADAIHKVSRHQLDLLLDLEGTPRYWVNTSSPKGYIVEKLLIAADRAVVRQPVTGDAVRYVDWLFPGILGMNMM